MAAGTSSAENSTRSSSLTQNTRNGDVQEERTRSNSLHSLETETICTSRTASRLRTALCQSSIGDSLTTTFPALESSSSRISRTFGVQSSIAYVRSPLPSRRAGSRYIASTCCISARYAQASAHTTEACASSRTEKLCRAISHKCSFFSTYVA